MRNKPTVRQSGVGTIRRTILILTSVVVGLTGSAVLASPANALVELYKHEYFGEPHRFELDNQNYLGDTFTDGSALNDQVTSINNWTGSPTCFYIDVNYGGSPYLWVAPWVAQVHIGSTYHDKLSSHNYDC